jgi:hypothetical protein
MISCNKKTDWQQNISTPADLINTFINEIEIESEVWIKDTLILMDIFDIQFIEGLTLIKVNHPPDQYHFQVFNFNTREFIGKYIKRGKGPYEYINCLSFRYKNDTIVILDWHQSNLCFFSANNINGLNDKPNNCIQFKFADKGDAITKLIFFNNYLICTGIFSNDINKVFDIYGNYLFGFGRSWEYLSKDTLSNPHIGTLFGGCVHFLSNMDQDKLAIGNSFGLKIFDYCPDNILEFSEIFTVQWSIPPVVDNGFHSGKPFVSRSATEYIGAGRFVSVGDLIFFPFSTYSIAESVSKGIINEYNYMVIIDWEGNPVAKLKLDKPIFSMLQKDLNEEYLYAKHTDIETGFPQVIRFSIKDILEKIN